MSDFEKNVGRALNDIQTRLAVLQAGTAVNSIVGQHLLRHQLSLSHEERNALREALTRLRNEPRKEHPAFIKALHQGLDTLIVFLT